MVLGSSGSALIAAVGGVAAADLAAIAVVELQRNSILNRFAAVYCVLVTALAAPG